MWETFLLIASVGFVLYSPMAETEAQEADWAKMAADLRKGLAEAPLDSEVGNCLFQDAVSVNFLCVKTSHRQTRNPHSATLAGSEAAAN